jgi:alpha-tubulin suppressor-like RCC1 family protein
LGTEEGFKSTPTLLPFNSNSSFISTINNIFCGVTHSLILMKNNSIYSFGSNSNGELGLTYFSTKETYPIELLYFRNLNDILDVRCGVHTLILLNNSEIYSFGDNSVHFYLIKFKQLGHFDSISRSTPQKISYFNNFPITGISAGRTFSFVFLKNKTVYSFGSNTFGETGRIFIGNNDPGLMTIMDKININFTNIYSSISTSKSIIANTEIFKCFGVNFNEQNVCSGNGYCRDIDTCSCYNGFFGANCQNYTCFGISQSNSSVCLGNGVCIYKGKHLKLI